MGAQEMGGGQDIRVVLGHSEGLDASAIVPRLRKAYGAELGCTPGRVGQEGSPGGLGEKALATGAVVTHGEGALACARARYIPQEVDEKDLYSRGIFETPGG